MHKNSKVLFLTLHTFSLTGGIEKVSKTFAKTLDDLKVSGQIKSYRVLSMYDNLADQKYIPQDKFKGYKGNRYAFGLAAVSKGIKADTLIISHIHLLLFAGIVKKLKPNIRIVLFAHGIEIWNPVSNWKKQLLNKTEIWAVSQYTARQIMIEHGTQPSQIKVLNNSLDPFFKISNQASKPSSLLNKYSINSGQKVLLTICRLSSAEQYKGYDLVIKSLRQVIKIYPDLVYILVGKADATESSRLNILIEESGLKNNIILTGFITDQELNLHYQLADVFIMPSKAEGFGLVFIEAAAHGCTIIGGNADGSPDALLNGQLGILIDPTSQAEIETAILTALPKGKENFNKKRCLEKFGYEVYKRKVAGLLNKSFNNASI